MQIKLLSCFTISKNCVTLCDHIRKVFSRVLKISYGRYEYVCFLKIIPLLHSVAVHSNYKLCCFYYYRVVPLILGERDVVRVLELLIVATIYLQLIQNRYTFRS